LYYCVILTTIHSSVRSVGAGRWWANLCWWCA